VADGRPRAQAGHLQRRRAQHVAIGDIMANDAEWVEDVKRWYLAGASSRPSDSASSPDDDVALGYEAAHPALQARHWPDAPLTTDR
jgi:hypothetical protein